jgi:hypothetical protein
MNVLSCTICDLIGFGGEKIEFVEVAGMMDGCEFWDS